MRCLLDSTQRLKTNLFCWGGFTLAIYLKQQRNILILIYHRYQYSMSSYFSLTAKFTLFRHIVQDHYDRNISYGVLLYSDLHPISSQHCTNQYFIQHSVTRRSILSPTNLSRTRTLPYPNLAHCRGSLFRHCLHTTQIHSPPFSYLPPMFINGVPR